MAEVFDFGLQQHKIKMDGKFFENNLFAVAGDTGRRLEVQLLDSDNLFQNTTGISLRLNADVAGQATYAEATLVDATKGLYELDLPNGMLIAPGNWQFQWQIIGATGEKLHSFTFDGTVGSNISEGGTEATNFYLNAGEIKELAEEVKGLQADLIAGAVDSAAIQEQVELRYNELEELYAPRINEVEAKTIQNKEYVDQQNNVYKPFLNNNSKVSTLYHIMAGIDSLTNGAGGTNWGKHFTPRAKAEIGDGGLGYIGFNNTAIVNDGHSWSFSGVSSLENLDQTIYPGKYSLDNKGVYAESASGGVITLNLTNRSFKHAKLIYLKQAGGGSFTTRYGTESNSKTVDTSSDGFDLGVVSLNDVAHNGQIFIQNITGKIVLFGIYIYNDEGLIFSKLGKGGDRLLNHSNTDDAFRKKWLEALKPDVFLFNGGTNDRQTMTSTNFDTTMRKYLQPFLDTRTQIVLIRPNDINGDTTWESYNAKLINYHIEKNTGYINEKELLGGDYSSALSLGYMYDTVHPSDLGNKKRSANYLDYFGIAKLGRNLSTVLEYQYKTILTPKKIDVTGVIKTTLYKIGLINGYPNGMLKLTIKGLRGGTAGMVEKTVYASIRNGTVLNNASFSDFKTVQNYEYRPDTIVTDFIVTVEVVNNLVEISVTPNTASNNMNFYVEGDVTMLYLPNVGRSVFEN